MFSAGTIKRSLSLLVPPQCLSARLQPTPNAAAVSLLATAAETSSPSPRYQRRGSSCAPTATTT